LRKVRWRQGHSNTDLQIWAILGEVFAEREKSPSLAGAMVPDHHPYSTIVVLPPACNP